MCVYMQILVQLLGDTKLGFAARSVDRVAEPSCTIRRLANGGRHNKSPTFNGQLTPTPVRPASGEHSQLSPFRGDSRNSPHWFDGSK
jgi:hypothetical protein